LDKTELEKLIKSVLNLNTQYPVTGADGFKKMVIMKDITLDGADAVTFDLVRGYCKEIGLGEKELVRLIVRSGIISILEFIVKIGL